MFKCAMATGKLSSLELKEMIASSRIELEGFPFFSLGLEGKDLED